MRRFLLASATSLAMVCGASSILAQAPATTSTPMSAEQKTEYDSWPADQRTSYDGWPADHQNYYWSLTPNQRTGWWALSDQQRQQLMTMDPPRRAAAWASIEKQLAAAPSSAGTGYAPGAPGGVAPSAATAPAGAQSADAAAAGAQSADTAAAAVAAPAGSGAQAEATRMNEPPVADAGKTYPPCTKTLQDNCRNRGGV